MSVQVQNRENATHCAKDELCGRDTLRDQPLDLSRKYRPSTIIPEPTSIDLSRLFRVILKT
jgi:hypothetical protein